MSIFFNNKAIVICYRNFGVKKWAEIPENTPGLLNNRHNPIDNQVNWYSDILLIGYFDIPIFGLLGK